MTKDAITQFATAVEDESPPAHWPALLKALWHEASGDWERAHVEVQAIDSTDSAKVHALLHRIEGDLANAAYWYRRAGIEPFQGSIEAERNYLVESLLGASA